MSNSFDFELVADDKVSGAIERINESLNDLQPKLDKTRTGLQFGGQETLDGLNGYNSRLELMAQSARDNVLQVQPIQNGSRSESALTDNLARSLKEAMSDQTLKLEITMVNDKGERKTYNVENNGRITTPMNY